MTMRLSHEQLDRHRADRGGGRHGERGVHVLRRCGPGRRAARCSVGSSLASALRGRLGVAGLGRCRLLRGSALPARRASSRAAWPRRGSRAPSRPAPRRASARASRRASRRSAAACGGLLGGLRRRAGGGLRRLRGAVAGVPFFLKYVVHSGRRSRILLELVVHLLDEPVIGSEVCEGIVLRRLSHGCVRLFQVRLGGDGQDVKARPLRQQMQTRTHP